MRIAGVDPGTINTGVAILETEKSKSRLSFSGTIRPGSDKPLHERLHIIYQELRVVFQEWKPDVLALETVFFQKDFKAAVKVGEARACAILAAADSGILVSEYPPARIKQAICSNGAATKEQIQYMVKKLLSIQGELSKDSADAIAVALCHFHSYRFEQFKQSGLSNVSSLARTSR